MDLFYKAFNLIWDWFDKDLIHIDTYYFSFKDVLIAGILLSIIATLIRGLLHGGDY